MYLKPKITATSIGCQKSFSFFFASREGRNIETVKEMAHILNEFGSFSSVITKF